MTGGYLGGVVDVARGHAESEDEADAADSLTTQPIARRWLQRREEHARGLHDVEPIHVVGSPP